VDKKVAGCFGHRKITQSRGVPYEATRMALRQKKDDPQRVLDAFRNLVKALRLADRAGLERHGLGSAQVFVLHQLNRESPLSINELAERTATDQSTVSVVVNKLVEKGFVTRERSNDDARRVALALTAKGRLTVRKLPSPIQHGLIESVRQLPASRARALAEMLEQVVGALGVAEKRPPMFFDE
jgi:DNA-binding MarR family transcriptional regulator